MGQYHYICNLDKREYLVPHTLGDGLKLLEFGASAPGTMFGLALLLAVSNRDDSPEGPFEGQRGGGDFHVWNDPYGDGRDVGDVTEADQRLAKAVIGRWGGDRIAIIGDYAEDEDIPSAIRIVDGVVVESHWSATDLRDNPWATEEGTEENPYWTDISVAVRRVMLLDYYTRQDWKERESWDHSEGRDPYFLLEEEATA